MALIMNVYIHDIILSLVLFSIIVAALAFVEKKGKVKWVNRKVIHLSSLPAALSYYYLFQEPYIFSLMCFILFALVLYSKLKKNRLSSIQLENNNGEVYYCLSWGIISLLFWNYRLLALFIMIAMALGDGLTGLTRYYVSKNPKKHKGFIGSVVMFLVCFLAFSVVSKNILLSLVLALVATIAEWQPFIDDNLAIPLITGTLGFIILTLI